MEAKYTLTLNKEFILYCELNDIKDVAAEAERIFNMGFALVKFGTKPGVKPTPPPSQIIKEGHDPVKVVETEKPKKSLYDE